MKVLLKGALLGGLAAFLWTNISWMVLPWHGWTISTVANENLLAEALKTSIPQSGLYILPWSNEHSEEEYAKINEKMEQGPYAYMVVSPNGFKKSMPKMMGFGLLFNILIAFVFTYLLSKTRDLSYLQKVGFIEFAAIAGALVIIVPNAIWWQFPMGHTLVTIADTAITWAIAGLAIGKIVKDPA